MKDLQIMTDAELQAERERLDREALRRQWEVHLKTTPRIVRKFLDEMQQTERGADRPH